MEKERKGIVICAIDGQEYNKQIHCPDYTCDTCPNRKKTSIQNNIFHDPRSFSTAYLGYLSNKVKIKTAGEEYGLPPLFDLSNIYRLWVILEQMNAEPEKRNTYIEFINETTLDALNNLSEPVKVKLNELSDKNRTKLLVALHDLTDAYIEENIVIKEPEKGQKELSASIEAVNSILTLPILGPADREVLLKIKSTLDALALPTEYSPLWHLHLSTMSTWPEGRMYDFFDHRAFDEYFVKHKNLIVKKTPYKFFKNSLQIVVRHLLVNEGGQKREAAKYFTAELINNYLSSSYSGKYKDLSTFTYKTVENAGSPSV